MDLPPAAAAAVATADDPSAAWDWNSLLDFSIEDDHSLLLSWPNQIPSPSPPPPSPTAGPDPPPPALPVPPPPPPARSRIRKGDPRLVCSNFLAGRVPCSCPEVDEMEGEDEEEEELPAVAGGKKRVRVGGVVGVARCQVLGCEADISELKGYHRRHRVCLQCANAPSVVIDGEHKRYCQQCGKFHILPDFDEGKRSCRRKLERHNKRRRRRPIDSRSIKEHERELQGDPLADVNFDDQRREMTNASPIEPTETVLNNKMVNLETYVEFEDGHGSPFCSVPSVQNVPCDSTVTHTGSDETNMEERIDQPKPALSSTLCDKKNTYSSLCPTGRISFKLYDWNPAEFPRRLRLQIFQWLASMPVELEGYIRPGCTILTVFISMPQFMWEKLYQDAALYVRNLIDAPESLLSGRGNMYINLSNKIIRVMKDGTSLMNIKMEVQVPRLHYVYPTYFEAGKPMEFVACGSNLDQPKFRFLVSFAGRYLPYDSCLSISQAMIRLPKENARDTVESVPLPDHEMFRINISCTEPEVFGPAFVEVENESGLSNFIPILFGNKRVCSELARMQGAFHKCPSSDISWSATEGGKASLCVLFTSKQTAMSDVLLDIAWLVKEPRVERETAAINSTNIQRIASLLEFLMENDLTGILKEIMRYVDDIIGREVFGESVNKISDADFRQFLKYVDHARETLSQKAEHDTGSELDSSNSVDVAFASNSHSKSNSICPMPSLDRDCMAMPKGWVNPNEVSAKSEGNISLISGEIVQRRDCSRYLGLRWHLNSWNDFFPRAAISARLLTVYITVCVVMCFSVCVALLHPEKASKFAVSLRRCLFGCAKS